MARYDFNAQRLYVAAELAQGARCPLTKEQANYLLNVLRMREGDPLLAFNGRQGEWRAQVVVAGRREAALEIGAQERPQPPAGDLDYLFAPLKHARLDYMVQKAVEMGATRLRPVLTRRTQAQRVNVERMAANAIEAAEQCGVLTVPAVDEPVKLERVLADWPAGRLLVFCDEDAPSGDPVAALRAAAAARTGAGGPPPLAVLVGPEGGFDASERRMLNALPAAVPVSLGPRILRADTAAVAALAAVQIALGDWRD
jgi:16S rRNA (uracil1498-N3)-methyltransferase